MARKSYDATRNELLTKALSNPIDKERMMAVATELDTNPRYSLEIDPTGELGMTKQEKEFTKWYIEHRNVAVAAQLAEIPVEDGMAIYKSFACQSELRRIAMVWQLRQLNNSTMSLDHIGSVLTGYVFDQLPESAQLSTKDKMAAMRMIMDIHALKQKVIEDARPIDAIDVEEQIKDLSADALKSLIEKTKSMDVEVEEKEEMIKELDDDSLLSNDDIHYLRTLPVEQLKQLIKDQEEAKEKIDKSKPEKKMKLTPVDETDVIDGDDVTGA